MKAYKRKLHYQNKDIAENYMERRFSDSRGERENAKVTRDLEHVLRSVSDVKTILDIPCGTGRFADFFYEKGYRYCGSDVSMEMISVLGKEQNKKGRTPFLVRCDAEALPFKDNVFDCAVCVRFLHHHMPDDVRVKILEEMRRVSRRWLIVQSQRLRYLGLRGILKVIGRTLLGKTVRRHRFRNEAVEAGWIERVPDNQHRSRYFEIYQKAQ